MDAKRVIEVYRTNRRVLSDVVRTIRRLAGILRKEGFERIVIMNFCGTHEWTTVSYGIRSLVPENVELVAGPGCPVCVTPSRVVEHALKLASEGVRVYVFGDAYRLRAVRCVEGAASLAEARALGYDVKVVYSFLDAIRDAGDREAVFLGIGFETTAPGYALPLVRGMVPPNLSLLTSLRLTPPAARYALRLVRERGMAEGYAVIAPGHVSTVTGPEPWEKVSKDLGVPVVISGFEPIDLLISVSLALKMIHDGEVGAVNEYSRAVRPGGNRLSLAVIREAFEVYDAAWRGIGVIEQSGLRLRERYSDHDAIVRYGLRPVEDGFTGDDLPPGCICSEVMLGLARPIDCPMFMGRCTPGRPWGPCMVSVEGTCSVWARHGGWRVDVGLIKELGVRDVSGRAG